MSMKRFRSHSPLLLAALAVLFAGIAFTQDKPDRPPWAQKPKSSASPNSTANSPSGSGSPASSPVGEPGKIVQPTPPAPTNDPQDPAAQRGRIRIDVNLVSVLVSILDEKNRPAPDLPREAFQLFEEGVEQKIDRFESQTSQPLDLAIMIDSSLSAHKEISFEQEAAAHFIRQVLRSGDRLSVFAFDENVTQLAAFSDNVGDLQAAVRRIPAGAGTSIYDAVVLGSRALGGRGDDCRRVILPVKNENRRNTPGEHALETMTDTTGGAMFYPYEPQELGAIFDRIDRELRTQYLLAYYPTPRGPANTYRSIVVTVDPSSYHVRHRKSYLTGSQ